MFVFGSVVDELFVFTQKENHIYTWPNEELAREFFESVKDRYHLYMIDPDLSQGVLVQRGTGTGEAPPVIIPSEIQKQLLFDSYVYKSLLSWLPPEEML